jgi:hypothetical protein
LTFYGCERGRGKKEDVSYRCQMEGGGGLSEVNSKVSTEKFENLNLNI